MPSEFRVFNAYPYLFIDPDACGVIFPKFRLTIFYGDPNGALLDVHNILIFPEYRYILKVG